MKTRRRPAPKSEGHSGAFGRRPAYRARLRRSTAHLQAALVAASLGAPHPSHAEPTARDSSATQSATPETATLTPRLEAAASAEVDTRSTPGASEPSTADSLPAPLPAPGPSQSSSASPPPVDDSSAPSNLVPIVLGSVGLSAVIVGTVTGLLALEEKGYTEDHCSSTQHLCDATGIAAAERGRTLAAVSAATLALGGLAVVGAFVLYRSEGDRAVLATRPTTAGAVLHLETTW